MFDRSVPVFVHYLKSLSAILSKGEAYCAARKIDPVVVLNTRLFPDMLPLVRQVQLASDASKGAGARLTGAAVHPFRTRKGPSRKPRRASPGRSPSSNRSIPSSSPAPRNER